MNAALTASCAHALCCNLSAECSCCGRRWLYHGAGILRWMRKPWLGFGETASGRSVIYTAYLQPVQHWCYRLVFDLLPNCCAVPGAVWFNPSDNLNLAVSEQCLCRDNRREDLPAATPERRARGRDAAWRRQRRRQSQRRALHAGGTASAFSAEARHGVRHSRSAPKHARGRQLAGAVSSCEPNPSPDFDGSYSLHARPLTKPCSLQTLWWRAMLFEWVAHRMSTHKHWMCKWPNGWPLTLFCCFMQDASGSVVNGPLQAAISTGLVTFVQTVAGVPVASEQTAA